MVKEVEERDVEKFIMPGIYDVSDQQSVMLCTDKNVRTTRSTRRRKHSHFNRPILKIIKKNC